MKKRLAIFCGSSVGNNPDYKSAAAEMGKLLAAQDIGMVYGGGNIGLMGACADAVMADGGEVIGIIPKKLMELEVGHTGISDLFVVDTMHERKAKMAHLSDGFIAMPGGIGTIEEIIEVFTWHQIGYHNKPCAFLNTNGYYDKFFEFLQHTVGEGFLSAAQKNELLIADTPEAILKKITPLI
ncbi:MAG: TIGR00730 family Rossman fold protein [Cyclobacteriaceae bacterium]